ncbi:hypothetical protein GCM10010112_71150 [Actinoplanes lobatus]|uniref:Outer membrane protein assembly factor BamB n=1 Tax=Actinoplanes lobatus TaxID=113568 RepID=A0A7W7HLY5_9ACTN|nr:PQQ-binding-like beta-propeller repeat protein [Actinoplanes lobatus]MBB4752906.1 outer membrane protein assembly factor BamB [Actinoplanes lobatus]GGN88030.1 hypothetical protein GCM10010112_71150 [Actinoplanes lobatus]GIE39514.1 hypothetical protein Alo02nite_24120 [Actinoplanes lobatus]
MDDEVEVVCGPRTRRPYVSDTLLTPLPWPVRFLVAADGAGPVYAVGAEGMAAVDLNRRVRWTRPVEDVLDRPRAAPDGTVWTTPGLHETGPDGVPRRRLELPREPGALITGFLLLADGFVVTWQPSAERHFARVERLDPAGRIVWAVTPPRVEGLSREPEWRRMIPRRSGSFLLASGDRMLVHYVDTHRTGVAVLFCLDLGSGELVWARPAARQPVITGPGEFETDPGDGRVLVSGKGQREVVTGVDDAVLCADGTIVERSDWQVRALTPGLPARRAGRYDDRRFPSRMLVLDDRIAVCGPEGVLFLPTPGLARAADGLWTCAEGNLRGNPAC